MTTLFSPPHKEALELYSSLFHDNTSPVASYLFVVDDEYHAELYTKQLKRLAPHMDIMMLPAFDCRVYDRISPSHFVKSQRARTLVALSEKLKYADKPTVLIASVDAFVQRVPPVSVWKDTCLTVSVGDDIARESLCAVLNKLGFSMCDTVRTVGDYAVRGGLMDCFIPSLDHPVRLDFFGDELEGVRFFDPYTQQSLRDIKAPTTLHLLPTSEVILTPDTIARFRTQWRAHAPSDARIYTRISAAEEVAGMEHFLPLFYDSLTTITEYLTTPQLIMGLGVEQAFAHFFEKLDQYYTDRQNPSFGEVPYHPLSPSALYLTADEVREHRARSILFQAGEPSSTHHHMDDRIVFEEDDLSTRALDHTAAQHKGRTSPQHDAMARFFQDMQTYDVGDYLAHLQHGVAQYKGLECITIGGVPHDCIVLAYGGDEKLFVPVENMDVLTFYAKEDAPIEVNHLGSSAWRAKRDKARQKLREVAQYLLMIAAQRALHVGPKITYSDAAYQAFAAGFPYMETHDQARAIEDVRQDLLGLQPMDRLVCGDVGFGKTEVALRAAFMVASSGYQVVVVVPTTLLARQHHKQWRARFHDVGIRVDMLCRLVSSKEASCVKARVANGETRILIATHAAFSKHLTFHNLGLLIVDEEHHFGVKQKEELKKLRSHLHILTLTATPIPRTLQMSFAGIRSLSLMATPPKNRLPVRTFVLEDDVTLMREVIGREINRGGQVFYVTPRLSDLPLLENLLKKHIPHIRIGVAHGQMPARALEDVMVQFDDHGFDVLLSTNIIESGIDVPNANTLIVHKAHLFGLAQLYQMRGRVGRGTRQGYAYLTLPSASHMKNQVEKRLNVLKSLDQLGSGFQLASYDLDMRGAGNLVGEEQSGHMRDMGAELYQQMLKEAVASARLDTDTPHHHVEEDAFELSPTLSIGIPIHIPESYISDLSVRLSLYKRASRLYTQSDITEFQEELIDRFGPCPKEVEIFLRLLSIKNICKHAGIERVESGPKGIVCHFNKQHAPDPLKLAAYVQKNAKILRLRPDYTLVLSGTWTHLDKKMDVIEKLASALARIAKPLLSNKGRAF